MLIWQIISGLLFFTLCLSVYLLVKKSKSYSKEHQKIIAENKEIKDYFYINPNPVMKIDSSGKCYFANAGSEPILTSWRVRLNQKIPKEWFEVIKQVVLSDKTQLVEIPCGEITYLASIVPLKGRQVFLFALDISSFKSLENELKESITIDAQTNLPNQVVFRKALDEESRKEKSSETMLGVFIIRFDDYAQITYTYGQETASKILNELAARISCHIDEHGLVARLSDNEFGIIDSTILDDQNQGIDLKGLIDELSKVYQVDDREIYISISLGITFCPQDGDGPDMLARNARLAVNRATSSTQKYAFFQRGMQEQLVEQRELVVDLHKAIEKQQFYLVYQPQIDLKTFQLIGCEALIRWNHPDKGVMSPFHFMAVAEQSDLILKIGDWILEQSCRQIVKWKQKGLGPIKVAVNLSAKQILETDLPGRIQALMKQYEITSEWLSIELTESALVEDKDRAIEVMNKLKKLGLELSLDDFGTGYSSLGYLVQFPIDKLKIDKSFVDEIKDEEEGHAVTKGIVDLGHNMGLKVVAEGVEFPEQLKYLTDCECDIIQGYIFGKPTTASEFEDFFHQQWKTKASAQGDHTPIKIGVLHSFTGTMSISEIAVANATLMAIDEINEAGGILGRKLVPVKADGQSEPGIFAKEAESLIDDHEVSVIFGIWNSHSRKAVKPIVEAKDHLLIYPMAYEGLEQSENIVYTGGIPNQIIMPTIKWAYDNLGKTFFLVGSDYIGPHANQAITIDQINAIGGTVVGEEYVLLGSHDFKDIVQKIIKTKPDVIINNNNGDGNLAFIAELRKNGITSDKTPMISFNMNEVEIKSLNPKDVAGDYASWNYFQNVSNDLNQTFINNYRKRYGKNAVVGDTIEAAYYGVYLWAQAVKDAGTDNLIKVRQKIKGQRFSAPGGQVKIDPKTQHTWKVSRIGKINEDGEISIVWSSNSPIRPLPYPSYRSVEEWEQFIAELYKGWGNNWSNMES